MRDSHNPNGNDQPGLVPGRLGTRAYTLDALAERVAAELRAERAGGLNALAEAPRAERLHAILAAADYVLAVESVALASEARAALVERVHADLFGLGPLDAVLADAAVTQVIVGGPDRAYARRGQGELAPLGALFASEAEAERIAERLLARAGAERRPELSVIEAGLEVDGRPVRLLFVGPPVAPALTLDLRLHPPAAPTLEGLVAGGVMTPEAAGLLRAIVASGHGLAIVGEGGTGKTTLLNALVAALPGDQLATVERAPELRPPAGTSRFVVRWPLAAQPGAGFTARVDGALAAGRRVLALDEVRPDDPTQVAPLLGSRDAPQLLAAVRGVPDAKRLQAALGMLARRARPGDGEAPVHALYARLPFVASLARVGASLRLFSLAEWQPSTTSDYPDYVTLLHYHDGAAHVTDRAPYRTLDS